MSTHFSGAVTDSFVLQSFWQPQQKCILYWKIQGRIKNNQDSVWSLLHIIHWYNEHFCCVFDEFQNYLKYTWGKKQRAKPITILVMDKRDQLLFTLKVGWIFLALLLRYKLSWMSWLGWLCFVLCARSFTFRKGTFLKASRSTSSTFQGSK